MWLCWNVLDSAVDVAAVVALLDKHAAAWRGQTPAVQFIPRLCACLRAGVHARVPSQREKPSGSLWSLCFPPPWKRSTSLVNRCSEKNIESLHRSKICKLANGCWIFQRAHVQTATNDAIHVIRCASPHASVRACVDGLQQCVAPLFIDPSVQYWDGTLVHVSQLSFGSSYLFWVDVHEKTAIVKH